MGGSFRRKFRKSDPVHCSEMARVLDLQHRLFLRRSFTHTHKKYIIFSIFQCLSPSGTRLIWWTWCWTFRHFFFWVKAPPPPQWARASSFTRFLDHTQRHTTVGRTPLDEWSARHKDLYLSSHNTHNRQTSMPLVGLEPAISAGERTLGLALDTLRLENMSVH